MKRIRSEYQFLGDVMLKDAVMVDVQSISFVRLALLAAVVGGPAVACSSEPSVGRGGPSALAAENRVQEDRFIELACGCDVSDGLYETAEQCFLEVQSFGASPAEQRCRDGHYAATEDARPFLECAIAATSSLNECVAGANCDVVGIEDCVDTAREAYDVCPIVPFELQALIALDCFGVDLGEPFTCQNGKEIPEAYQCDAEDDCGDGSDEAGCPGQFECADGSGYVPETWICDGVPDCPDGSDEPGNCEPPQGFQCSDGFVIPAEWVCDGFPDCLDGSDELDC